MDENNTSYSVLCHIYEGTPFSTALKRGNIRALPSHDSLIIYVKTYFNKTSKNIELPLPKGATFYSIFCRKQIYSNHMIL